MDVFTMVVLIVIVTCTVGLAKTWIENRRSVDSTQVDDVFREVDSLRDRVKALEAIVTDSRFEVDREIADLERRSR